MTDPIAELLAARPYRGRSVEWMLVAVCIAYGAWLIMPWGAIRSPVLDFPASEVHERLWGGLFFGAGLANMFALRVNGRRWWTPAIRMAALLVTIAAFAPMLAASFQTSPGGLGVCTFLIWLCICLYCLFRARRDYCHARRIKDVLAR